MRAVSLPDDCTVVARLAASETVARRLLDHLSETFDATRAVVGAFADGGARWTVTIHFRGAPNETAVRALVALIAGAEAGNALSFETLAAKDWVKASLEGLPPVTVGRFVVHGAHDRARVSANRIGIEIEAALAFGTGHHGTTRGCLHALDRLIKVHSRPGPALGGAERRRVRRSLRILDLGTGSGVLALAAARALRAKVLASDSDPRAVATARQNARLNRARVEIICADGLKARRFKDRAPFDIVLANILLEPLKQFAVPIKRLLAPGGYVVLSGLQLPQANAALASYRGLALRRRIVLDGWATLVLQRALP